MSSRTKINLPPTVQVKAKARRILIVDDEPLVRRFIEASLRADGYDELLFGSSGSTVPSVALSERPDLIIMDVMMPGGNGLRALRILKQNANTAGIPVIMTSGFNVLTLEDCVQSRPDYLLAKPFTAAQLLKQVGRLLGAPQDGAAPLTIPMTNHPGATAGIPAAPAH